MAPRCFAIPNPIFQPSMTLIAAITNSNPAVVTTTFAHNYKTGLIVRLDIPAACGMPQANGTDGAIVVTSPTTFNYALDTTTFEPFAIPMSPPPAVNICAQCVPIGEVNQQLDSAVQNVLPFGPI
jgi:hypothetical protein